MEIEETPFINKKKNFYSFNENSNTKDNNLNIKLLLSDGIFRSKNQTKLNFLLNNDYSNEKKNSFFYPNCRVISSLFTKDNINKVFTKPPSDQNNKTNTHNITNSNDIQQNININNNFYTEFNPNNTKENNTLNSFIINYKIYNIKENSIFHIKLYDQYIKFFPIFSNLTDFEKYICYNPFIENNEHFELITQNCIHETFYVKNYDISNDKLEILKDKYIKHLYTKRNIISVEEIFKYIFEEIKINISCINVQSPFDDVLKNCSNLINSINEIITDIINDKKNKENIKINKNNNFSKIENINNFEIRKKDDYPIINNNIKKSFVLGEINSKSIQNNFLEINKSNRIEEDLDKKDNRILGENDNVLEKEVNKEENKNEEKNKKESFICPFCPRKFNSHCGLGGHMSKRHPKNQNQNQNK